MWLLDLLFPPREDERVLRGFSDEQFLALLSPRLVPETRPSTVALLPFSARAVRAAVHEAKYHRSDRATELLGSALVEYLRDADEQMRRSVLVPIPLGVMRQKERGYNQVEEVVRYSSEHLGTPVDMSLLLRTRETISQVSLRRAEREQNMKNAFEATRAADPATTYIVVDDVITTGATLQTAVDALLRAGAAQVLPIALAH